MGHDATPEPVSVEEDFAIGKPEPSAGDFRDGLAEQGTAGGHEHQVKTDQFQAFISGLSMAERFRVLGLPKVHAVRLPANIPAIRSAIGLSRGNPESGALYRGNSRSAVGGSSFNVNAASRKFSNLDSVEFRAPPVMTREEQIAREIQEHDISAATPQDKTETASARLAQAVPHAYATDFTQISSDSQPRSAAKTLVTSLSPSGPNARYYAPFPENDDPDTRPNLCVSAPQYPNSHDVFTSGDLSAKITKLQDEATLCGQQIASYPNEVQRMRATMGRHERFPSELVAGLEAEKDKANLDWRRALECLDRKRGVSLAEHDHRRR